MLFIPQVHIPQIRVGPPPESEETPPKPEPKKADIIKHTAYKDTGVEGELVLTQVTQSGLSNEIAEQLENTGNTIFGLGIAGGFIALFVAIVQVIMSMDTKTGDPGTWFVVGVVAMVQGFVFRLFCRAGAEIIWLLQDSNESKLTGKIIQRSVHHSYKCSLCNAAAQPAQVRCSRCGAEFKP